MALNFPKTPFTNETYAAPNGVTYVWDGSKWTAKGATSGVPILPDANGNVTIPGTLTVQGATITGNAITVTDITGDSASLSGDLTAANSTLSGDLTAAKSTISGDLSAGDLSASNATLSGNLSAVNSTLSGDLSAVNSTLSGDLSAVDLTATNADLSGNLNVAGDIDND